MKKLVGLLMISFFLHGTVFAVEEIFSIKFEEIKNNLIKKSDVYKPDLILGGSRFFLNENEDFFVLAQEQYHYGLIYGNGHQVFYLKPDDYKPLFRNGSVAGKFYNEKCALEVNGEIIYSFKNDPNMKGRSHYGFENNRFHLSDFIFVKTGKQQISIRSIKNPYEEINQLEGYFHGLFPMKEVNIICYKEQKGYEFTFSELKNNGDINVLSRVQFEDDRYSHQLKGILPKKEIAVFGKFPYSWKFLFPRSARLIIVDVNTGEIISEQDWPKGSVIFTSNPMEGFDNHKIKIKSR